jgi:hypothetical protein
MPRIKILFAMFALLFAALACNTIMGQSPAPDESSSVTEAPFIEEEESIVQTVACQALTDEIIRISLLPSELESEEIPEETMLVTYSVDGDEIHDPLFEDVASDLQDEQLDEEAQRQIWEYYAAIIPAENRATLTEYAVFTDGVDNTLAAVTQAYSDPADWSLQVDIADTYDYYSLTFTLIHEYGHLLTLAPDQVPPSLAVFNNPEDNDIYLEELSACPNYFPGEGCANSDSYINEFYDRFWTDIHDEWNEINFEEDDDIYYEKLDEFYYKYEDQFVSDYAPTSPAEDLAEVWSFFILGQQPAGETIAEEKVLFFYNYPELVELRSAILNNICTSFPQ